MSKAREQSRWVWILASVIVLSAAPSVLAEWSVEDPTRELVHTPSNFGLPPSAEGFRRIGYGEGENPYMGSIATVDYAVPQQPLKALLTIFSTENLKDSTEKQFFDAMVHVKQSVGNSIQVYSIPAPSIGVEGKRFGAWLELPEGRGEYLFVFSSRGHVLYVTVSHSLDLAPEFCDRQIGALLAKIRRI